MSNNDLLQQILDTLNNLQLSHNELKTEIQSIKTELRVIKNSLIESQPKSSKQRATSTKKETRIPSIGDRVEVIDGVNFGKRGVIVGFTGKGLYAEIDIGSSKPIRKYPSKLRILQLSS